MPNAVRKTLDFERIRNLPEREVTRARGEELSRELTPLLTTAAGKRAGARLNWLQAYGIHEASRKGGAYLQLPVGSGKTLLTYLLPYVFDAQRPVLVVPSALVEKTHKEFRKLREDGWVEHDRPTKIVTLRDLVQDANVRMLGDSTRADLYLLDEVDLLSNQNSSMAKRLARDISERNVRTVATTGTGGRFSILDISHLLTWALKDEAPVPILERADGSREVEVWADALDEKTAGEWMQTTRRRTQPGALHELIALNDNEWADDPDRDAVSDLGLARMKFRKRLQCTEGCIISDFDSCDKKLSIELVCAPQDSKLETAFRDFRLKRLPNGEMLTDSLSVWAEAKNLGRGYFTEWIDPPPDWWNDPRKAYGKLCEKVIWRTAWTPRPLDTRKAVHREFPDHPIVKAWEEVEKEWEGERRPVWLSASVVEDAAAYGRKHHCLLWTESIVFGETLADATGLPFYGAQGLTVSGDDIELDPGRGTIILSTGANMRGRNLQDRWHHSHITGCLQSARYNEQWLGRIHRYGQKLDCRGLIKLTSGDSLYSFDRALDEAGFVHQTQGHRQKLLRAEIKRTTLPTGTSRWRQGS